jgi:hypothetical protein
MIKVSINIDDYIEIYTDVESDHFGFGQVVAMSDDDLIIASFDPAGKDDGLILYNFDAICKIQKDTQYAFKIKKLISINGTKNHNFKFDADNLLKELFEFSQESNKFVEIELQNSNRISAIGSIKYFDETICEINLFDEYGKKDGSCILLIEDISSIKWNSVESQDLSSLSEQ